MEKIKPEGIKGLVSIIIPTHNRANLICKTLDSIKSQSYQKIEVIVVDDNSDDDTNEIILDYIKNNPSLNLIFQKNAGRGGCSARNTGLRTSKGDYIQFFDDDDLMNNNHIEKKVRVLQECECDYCACDYSYFDNLTGSCIGHKKISSVVHNCSSHLLTLSFPCPAFMCKRDTIIKMGFWNDSLKALQDMAYFHRLFMIDLKGVYLQEELFKVRIHDGSLTSKSLVMLQGYYARLASLVSIENEWKNVDNADKQSVLKSIHFLQFSVGRNMYNCGFKYQGIKKMIGTILKNIPISYSLLKIALKYKTIHLTSPLLEELQ